VRQHIPFKLGVLSVVFDGSNVGFMGAVAEINWTLKRRLSTVALKSGEEVKRTILNYVMPVGEETPALRLQ
jgi:small subunit ribosomal protein S4e